MNFRKVNNITGWVVCVIACLVYILTAEATGSFWDTGEFIASAAKLQLPHPPGAPVFTLLGRFFIILFGGSNPAFAVNVMSAVASGFTILFLFWTITHFARKLVVGTIAEPNASETLTIIASGIVGALAYTFTDSFWFSAVEGEVYALSSFFTALVFWAMLKWERADDLAGADVTARNHADRWIIFIFFMMGLSIGVHLLNLLTIPALVMIYYFKRYNYTRKGAIIAFLIGIAITGVVQLPVIQWTVKLAGRFDIWFVNGLNLPFFSGFIFFFILLAAGIWFAMRAANRNGWSYLRLGLWSLIFMLIGYSAYVTTLIRSNANPALDMNNVDNPMNLVYYLSREQYGEAPLVRGPHFQAEYEMDESGRNIKFEPPTTRYERGEKEYIPVERPGDPVYKSSDIHLFPRVWDGSDQQDHANFYIDWLNIESVRARELSQVTGLENGAIQVVTQTGKTDAYYTPSDYNIKVQQGQVVQPGEVMAVKKPGYGHHIEWFMTYQLGFMYWRYFMWNFAGKQNDLQAAAGTVRDGNWITGLSFLDTPRLGDQSKMPDSIKNNKANNKLFLLPFILGIAGCVFHLLKNRKDWIVTFLLFFFTGLAVVLYLNQPGNQPRERDYAYVGSFYAFAIWIGLSVVGFVRMAREVADKKTFYNVVAYSGAASFLIFLMSTSHNMNTGSAISSFLSALFVSAVIAVITLIVRAVSGRDNWRTATIAAFALCMLAPVIMAAEEWNDHDRSQKTLAPAMAKNYLQSCAPNSIVFTFGDNDTYPLWYAQEVEGVRPDIRIVNTSLLGIDWYVNQLRYSVNESAPLDVILTPDQIRGVPYIRYRAEGAPDKAYDLLDVMKGVIAQTQNPIATFPVKNFVVPVDPAVSASLAQKGDVPQSAITFSIPEGKNHMTLDEVTILNIIATTKWQRPIYFTSYYNALGFGQYLRKEGLVYRLVPFASTTREQSISDRMDEIVMKFSSGNANKKGVYFDEENRRHLLSLRAAFAESALKLADEGNKPEAVKVLNYSEGIIPPDNVPYAMVSGRGNIHNRFAMLYLDAAYRAGHTDLVKRLSAAIRKDLTDQQKYYQYLKEEKTNAYNNLYQEEKENEELLQYLNNMEKQYASPGPIINELQRADTSDTTRRP
jgi:MFS family permease